MKTLVVDDDTGMCNLLEVILKSRGHEVTLCKDMKSALDAYGKDTYPLVLLDWMLPDGDGLDVCRRIRSMEKGDRSVIVMITAKDSANDLKMVLAAGADDYLAKPVDANILNVRLSIAQRTVENLLERKSAELRLQETYRIIEQDKNDLLSILNGLRIGAVVTDSSGIVTFINQEAARIMGKHARPGDLWEHLFLFQESDKVRLKAMAGIEAAKREKVPVTMKTPDGRCFWMEIEVQDDPQEKDRKLFFIYDKSEVHDLRRLLDEKFQFHDLIGKSSPMMQVFQQIRDISQVDWTVLIEGDTGTGKELVAHALHHASHRRDKPFIAVNCAGLNDSLLSSQLFGHRRGAFTGAIEEHKGFFEAAHGGTIFLDEIGDISNNLQTSLLRVLENREIIRVGETAPRKVDVRVIAATHRDLLREAGKGVFRQDLLYRIRVARINLPALRHRREDIPLIAAAFLARGRAATGKSVQEISTAAMGLLLDYHWPGNVRELKSAVEFALIHCKSSVIMPDDLPPEILDLPFAAQTDENQTDENNEVQLIKEALRKASGNHTTAARLLGIGRATLYRRLAKLKVLQEPAQE